VPFTLVAFLPNVLIVNPNLGVNSVQDLIALLKRDPSKRSFASSGSGTSTHLAGELFADVIGVPLTHIPYKGTPPAMQDVVGGQVPFMFDQMTAAVQLAQAGKLKVIATTAGKRTTLDPDLPTRVVTTSAPAAIAGARSACGSGPMYSAPASARVRSYGGA